MKENILSEITIGKMCDEVVNRVSQNKGQELCFIKYLMSRPSTNLYLLENIEKRQLKITMKGYLWPLGILYKF